MKAKLDIAVTILFCSIPAFAAGWKWHSAGAPDTEEPVNQVIRAIESAEAPADPASSLQTAAIFDSLHKRTVASFAETFESFGRSRLAKVEEMRHTDLWTLHPGRTDGFQVALIGLDREEPVRFESAHPEGGGGAVSTWTFGRTPIAPLPAGDPLPLDPLDLAGVETLSGADNPERAIFPEHDSVVAYGPIRASANCLLCHDGDAGELLGVFRYTFPLPVQPLKLRLAGAP